MNNTVIEVLDAKHGEAVIAYFKSLGINTGINIGYKTKQIHCLDRYYGVINGGVFSNFTLAFVNKHNIKIIILPTKKEDMKRIMSCFNAQKIINSACDDWKVKLADMWSKNIVLSNNIEIDQSFYLEMRKACTSYQNLLFDEIFGKEKKEIDLTDKTTIFDLSLFASDGNPNFLIDIRHGGNLEKKSFYLNKAFNWEIKKDSEGTTCLVITHK